MADQDQAGATAERVFDVSGNRVTLLPEGSQRLAALLDLIAGARSSLRLLYYIYKDDHTGTRLRAALLTAIERGVRVSLIVDGFGSDADAGFFLPLEKAGGDVCRFIPRFGRRYLLRNHQKLALADEARVIIGGFNIEDSYFDDDAQSGWRDLGALVEGPAVARLAGYYDALASWAHRPRPRMRDLRHALHRWSEPRGEVRWLFGGPTRRLSPWARTMRTDMRRARQIAMITAYFAPNPAVLRRIEAVAQRGIARIITPAKLDHNAMLAAARHCYARLLRHGVEIHEYQPMKLHTKLFIVGNAVHLGSANFDVRSLFLNLELMLRIEDRAFADHCRDYFERERSQSRRITLEEHRANSSLWNRIVWGVTYFVVAVLDSRLTRRLSFGVKQR